MSNLENKIKPVYAFIDSQNLNLGVKDQGWDLDFYRFRIYLRDKYDVEKAFLFIGKVLGKENLYNYLENCGYIMIYKPTLPVRIGGLPTTKGNVDAELVLHTMIEYPNYIGAVVVSGDGDFHCLLEYLENMGKLTRLVVPNQKKYSQLLYKFSKKTTFVNELRRKVGRRHVGN